MTQIDINPFDVNLHEWGLISFALIPALINIGIFVYSSLFLAKSATNRTFSVFVLLLALGQIADGFMRISNTEETALVWNRISIALWSFITPAGLLFTLYYARWHKKINPGILNLVLFLPAIACVLFILAQLNVYEIVPSETMNWIANPIPGSGSITVLTWIAANGLIMLLFLWLTYFRKDRTQAQKKQSLALAIGYSFPFAAGFCTEVIMPLAFDLDTFPLVTPMITVFSVAAFVAISKYRLFDYSPKHQWNQIVEKMNEGLLIVDNSERVMYANKSFCDLLEYSLSEIKGKVASELLCANEDATRKVREAKESRKQLISSQYEMQVKTKSGKKIWVLMSGSPYLNSEGKIIGSIGIQTNIDYLKEVEKKVRLSTLRLKQAQSVAHMGSWELDIATGKCALSEEACRIYGLSPFENEQTFKFLAEHVHDDDIRMVFQKIREAKSTLAEKSFEHRIVLQDGKVKHIHSICSSQLNDTGDVIGVLGICQDITEQRNKELAHIASEQRMQIFVNHSLLPIYFLDATTKKIVFANEAMSTLLGYSTQELLGMEIYEFVNHTKDDVDHRIDLAKQKRDMVVVHREWKAKSGRIVNVLVSVFYQEGSDFNGVYVAAQDITEIKLAQKNMTIAREELETYIYKSSHDLRAPLASILGLVTVSKMEVKDPVAMGYTISHYNIVCY